MYFRNLFRLYFQKETKPLLHRWYMTTDKKHLARKIYLATYDHCGPCGKILLKDEKNK